MSIIKYLKARGVFLTINIMIYLILVSMMVFLKVGVSIIFLVFCIWFIPIISYIIIEILNKKKFYDEIIDVKNSLDQKYLLTEVIQEPDTYEEKLIFELLDDVYKDMYKKVKYYKDMQLEYREYIETWVHEIKTPIASTRLILENHRDLETMKIDYELKKVERFIEQVLYYSRSSDVSKDYIVKEFKLDKIIRETIKNNSRDFINKRITLDIKEINETVFSDVKWVGFVLNQIIGNAIKYIDKEQGKISIYSKENKDNIVLTVEDNGIGILGRDINRVFEKGFTGENGRLFGKSTGIGLYLCKQLCDKLGLGIKLESEKNIGTKVSIIFSKGRMTNF